MGKIKSNHIAVCIICAVLTAFGIAGNIGSLIGGGNDIWTIKDIINLLVLVFIGYYAFRGYRKPNGNLLKWIILVFAVTELFAVYNRAQQGMAGLAVIRAAVIGLLCYMAGRLHRVKQNIVLMSITTVLIIINIVSGSVKGFTTLASFTSLIIWIDICAAYILRYREHKLAGFMDKVKD